MSQIHSDTGMYHFTSTINDLKNDWQLHIRSRCNLRSSTQRTSAKDTQFFVNDNPNPVNIMN